MPTYISAAQAAAFIPHKSVFAARHFPTSPLAHRTNESSKRRQVAAFADAQAKAATIAADILEAFYIATQDRPADWLFVLRWFHQWITDWRHELAVQASGRLGTGIAYNPERFRTRITEGTTNFDRIGRVGRLRDGATWDPTTRTFVGGADTPAYLAMLSYGAIAADRFAREAPDTDVLQNWVTLPDGRRIAGNRILRGAAATNVAAELAARVEARGMDASQVETGGELYYTATPRAADSQALFDAALQLLAAPKVDVATYLLARYCLFQAPQFKKGSDAVNRTFIVAVGGVLLGRDAPALPADIDLQCYVLGQDMATLV